MAEIIIKKYVCDVCGDCRKKLVEAVRDGFAEIADDYGVTIRKKKF